MQKILYNISIALLNVLLKVISPLNGRAKRLIQGRKGWHGKLKEAVDRYGEGMLWFHCASLGEFEQGRPVIEQIKNEHPDRKILLTFFSPSGYEVRKKYDKADMILYLPSDTRSNASQFIQTARPCLAVFIKYEFWYNFIDACEKFNVPIISISTIFRPSQFFFKPWGGYFRKHLKKFSFFFVQDKKSEELLAGIGIGNVTVSGDTRFDRVSEISSNPREISQAAKFCGDASIMVLGSTWPSDMKILYPLINDPGIPLKFIIAPHHVHEKQLVEIENALAVPSARFSAAGIAEGLKVLLIDNVGMLYSLYRYATIAYVGGAFHGGLHNILEPAAYGIPVLFGNHPTNSKFRETGDLIRTGGGFAVRDGNELRSVIMRLTNEREFYSSAAQASRKYISGNTGATEKIVTYIGSRLK